ncbi:hypothetical protein QJS66_18470 [Kocuria rhizophila]|nr:hypothetical protein QJS66_18470 [Kocuria rhizophila]
MPERFGLTPQQCCDASVAGRPAGPGPAGRRRARGERCPSSCEHPSAQPWAHASSARSAGCRWWPAPRGRLPLGGRSPRTLSGITPWCEQRPGQCGAVR